MSSLTFRGRQALALLFLPAAAGCALWLFAVWETPHAAAGWYRVLGKLCALVGIGLAPAVAALGMRQPKAERYLGLERMLRMHQKLGVFVVVLLVAHASLMIATFTSFTGRTPLQALQSFAEVWEMLLGMSALGLVLLATAPAGFTKFIWKQRRQLRQQERAPSPLLPSAIPFSYWKPLHLLLYVAVPAGMLHGYFRGSEMNAPVFVGYWLLCLTLFLACASQRSFLLLKGHRRMRLRVAAVRPENHDIATIVLQPEKKGALPPYLAGQFMLLRIPLQGRFSEPHPFTIACPAPPDGRGGQEICFSVKRGGRFTQALHELEPGTTVRCEGPYGVFCRDAARALPHFTAGEEEGVHPEHPLALIAGGIGITPFLCLLRAMAQRQTKREGQRSRQVHVVWANKTVADAFALDELKTLSKVLDLSVTLVFSRQTVPEGLGVEAVYGHVERELLERLFSGGEAFHLCGPPAMQQSVLHALHSAFGLHESAVERELFIW